MAAKLNFSRLWTYAKASGGRSLVLSLLLMITEVGALFYAWRLDRKAKSLQARGIPILRADLVPIVPLHEASYKMIGCKQASEEVLNRAKRLVGLYKKQSQELLQRGDFQELAACSYEALQQVRVLEQEGRCHFVMLRHLIESIGYGALHSLRYSEQSSGESRTLSCEFLALQLRPVGWAPQIDRLAQKSHACGVGILYNELPFIPFEEEWQDRSARVSSCL